MGATWSVRERQQAAVVEINIFEDRALWMASWLQASPPTRFGK